MQTVEVNNKEDLQVELDKILSRYGRQRLVFRGQVKDWPLIPSMYRGTGCIPNLTVNWSVSAERLISQFKTTKPTNIEIQAVMQHYGYRSFFIDVTSDPEVALWFALHKFGSKRTPIHINSQLKSAVFQFSQYKPSPSGFIYSILLPPEHESNDRCFDLTSVMPIDATRAHRQKAGAIFCNRESKSIDDLVVSKIQIVDDGWFRNSLQNINTTVIFPPPSVDKFYRSLCTLPYYITLNTEMKDIRVGHPLLGFFPIYAESVKFLVKEYVPLTKILSSGRLGLKWNVATAVIDLENQRIKARGATRVSFSSLMIETISHGMQVSKELPTDCWPSSNLLLEFEPEASLVSLSPKTLQEVLRGLWIVIGKKTIMIAIIIDRFDDISIGHECRYSLPELKLAHNKCTCPDHTYELEIFRKASELLKQKILHLEKGDSGYLTLVYGRNNK